MGTFVDDYEWIATVDTGKTRLDINNGRFCVTPEYHREPMHTLSLSMLPTLLCILTSLERTSILCKFNYESKVTQQSIPSSSERLFIPGTLKNGSGEIAYIDAVSTGSVTSVDIEILNYVPNWIKNLCR